MMRARARGRVTILRWEYALTGRVKRAKGGAGCLTLAKGPGGATVRGEWLPGLRSWELYHGHTMGRNSTAEQQSRMERYGAPAVGSFTTPPMARENVLDEMS